MQNELIIRAFQLACEFIRKYPAVDMDAYLNNNCVHVLAGGTERDPQGIEYMMHFIDMASAGEKIK